MQPISYARHQFLSGVIRHAVWLYLRFTLSYRDVELLAERGLDVAAGGEQARRPPPDLYRFAASVRRQHVQCHRKDQDRRDPDDKAR
jgi:hypothetical protein